MVAMWKTVVGISVFLLTLALVPVVDGQTLPSLPPFLNQFIGQLLKGINPVADNAMAINMIKQLFTNKPDQACATLGINKTSIPDLLSFMKLVQSTSVDVLRQILGVGIVPLGVDLAPAKNFIALLLPSTANAGAVTLSPAEAIQVINAMVPNLLADGTVAILPAEENLRQLGLVACATSTTGFNSPSTAPTTRPCSPVTDTCIQGPLVVAVGLSYITMTFCSTAVLNLLSATSLYPPGTCKVTGAQQFQWNCPTGGTCSTSLGTQTKAGGVISITGCSNSVPENQVIPVILNGFDLKAWSAKQNWLQRLILKNPYQLATDRSEIQKINDNGMTAICKNIVWYTALNTIYNSSVPAVISKLPNVDVKIFNDLTFQKTFNSVVAANIK